jgi:hypothetical protein
MEGIILKYQGLLRHVVVYEHFGGTVNCLHAFRTVEYVVTVVTPERVLLEDEAAQGQEWETKTA